MIRGKVKDKNGNALKGISIMFYSAASPKNERLSPYYQYTYTLADGTWSYRFPKGEVYIYIRTDIPGAEWSRQDYTLNIKDGQEITDIDFELNITLPDNSPYR